MREGTLKSGATARGARRRILNVLMRIPPSVRAPLSKSILGGYRTYLGWRAARTDDYEPPDGLPLPPARLRVRMGLTLAAHPEDFFREGKQQWEHIVGMVDRAGGLPAGAPVLDFGCGCGRLARWWQGRDIELHGCDPDVDPAEWCDANLPMKAVVTGMNPPLPYDANSFALIYALSVVTHFPEDLEREWLTELRRVLKPGGLLWFSTMGGWYLDRLTEEQRAAYDRGERVTRFGEVPGTNLCAAWHPPPYVESLAAGTGFELVEFVPGRDQPLTHDSWLLRRPDAES